jgi:hypothetical protein
MEYWHPTAVVRPPLLLPVVQPLPRESESCTRLPSGQR